MKQVQINKNKVNIFEEKELKEKFNLKDNEIKLILDYQRLFPELLQDEEGFVINSRQLHKELGNKRQYSDWIKQRIDKYKFIKDIDFVEQNLISQKSEIKNTHGGDRKSKNYMLTLEMAKSLAMIENNNNGKMVRDYFILMEKTLRKNEEWNMIRGIEKNGWNSMKQQIVEWVIRKNGDPTIDYFYVREANMINVALTGFTATELRSYINTRDKVTREHLSTKYNKAITEIQTLNESLLMSDLDFEIRKNIIKTTCINKYSELFLNKIETKAI